MARIVFILSIVLFSSQVNSALKVGIIDIPPFSFSDGQQRGIHIDYVREVFKLAKIPATLQSLPYPRVVEGISAGKVDIALMFRRDELPNTIEVCKSFGFHNLIVTRKGVHASNLKGLENLRVGVIRKAQFGKEFNEADYFQKIYLENYSQSFKMLRLSRLEAFIISRPAFLFFKQSPKFQDISFEKSFVFNKRHNYFYAHKDVDRTKLNKLQKANQALLDSNFIETIVRKYLID